MNQSKDLFKGALVLTIAALITKILSAFYRIPFQNIVGDVGFYIYQQVYPFYGAAVVLTTTGFPVVISKMYAEFAEKKDLDGARRFLLISFIFLQLFGLICFMILYFGSGKIALLMKDPNLAILLKVVSLVFLLFPLVSLIRGYYQGKGNMVPTAISQVGEQSTRVLTIIILSYIFMQKGYSLYLVGGGAMFGSITGSIVSVIILFTFFSIRKEWKWLSLSRKSIKNLLTGSGWIYKALIFQGLTICISGMLLIFMQMADAMNLYSLLVSSGIEKEAAKSLKGIFDRGQPLIQMGTVAATSMSLSLVPIITSERLKKKPEYLLDKIKLALQISIVIGAGASAGLWAIIEPTNTMLFENNIGSSVLGVLGFVILFTSIISTITAIMQGLEKLLFPAIVIVIGFPIKYGLNLLLVPQFETMGAAVSTIITLALLSVIMSIKLRTIIGRPLFTWKFFRSVILAVIVMILFLKGYLAITSVLHGLFVSVRIAETFQAVSAALFGGLLFLGIVVRSDVFSEEDLSLFPFGSKLAMFLKHSDRSRKYGEKN
ncbi:polysaccharide biosynthesis protein [Bacillus sp. EB600]|uniref:putative polysaccharide biosynthesis protein n=1 Tax=Bacillus sp. EB600 TaxID=2806345 RepID=UPI0028110731|nr:polysaccharide biosynthesis protein [Bacillus sp. EB600]